jgi:hypothetical protein
MAPTSSRSAGKMETPKSERESSGRRKVSSKKLRRRRVGGAAGSLMSRARDMAHQTISTMRKQRPESCESALSPFSLFSPVHVFDRAVGEDGPKRKIGRTKPNSSASQAPAKLYAVYKANLGLQ